MRIETIIAMIAIIVIFPVISLAEIQEQQRIGQERVSVISSYRECKVDLDCKDLYCPQVVGMDTPRCKEYRCVCGPNPKIDVTKINYTLIDRCLRIRAEIRERIKAGNISEAEMLQIRERYRECLPQVEITSENITNKIREIEKKYIEEKRNITASFVEAIKEINEMKIDLVLNKELTGKELSEKIREINEKRKEIVKDYVEKIHELNLARREELKEAVDEIRIHRKVEVNGVLVNVSRIVIKVNDKEVEIKPGDNVTISVEGVMAKSKINIKVKNETIIDEETNKTINVTPERVRERIRERVKEMILERKGNMIVYSVSSEKPGRILGLIPVNVEINYEISAEDGKEISIKKPWWSFLVIG
ncbi:MAG: hypothetical protein QXP52_02690 [Candidatus Aenigmatarchaeota archaeon]